jgi:alkylation response protein AidB-like acyl-CoA dehydrogenase
MVEDTGSVPNFAQSEESRAVTSQIDEFIKQEVKPLEDEYDQFLGEHGRENAADEDGKMSDEFLELTQEIRRKSAEAGFLTMHLPERVGGGGVSNVDYLVALDHLYYRHPDGFHGYVLAHGPEAFQGPNPSIIDAYDDEYQREKYFEPMMNVEKEMAFALTEPEHGSDITWMDSTGVRDGDEWVLNGAKCFISNAAVADFFVVSVRTSREDGDARGISTFFVDADNPGIEVGKLQFNMGDDMSEYAFVHLDDCRVPEKNMIGEEGVGFINTAIKYVGVSRLTLPAFACGRSQWMFDRCVEYCEDRKTFGKPIGTRQFMQGKLTDIRVDIEQVRWLYRYAAWKQDQGEGERWLQSAAHYRGSELWNETADKAVQIHGGSGVMSSLPFAYEYKKSRAPRIYDGTTEIHKRNIAREFLDL